MFFTFPPATEISSLPQWAGSWLQIQCLAYASVRFVAFDAIHKQTSWSQIEYYKRKGRRKIAYFAACSINSLDTF